jgi:hypothetical protein
VRPVEVHLPPRVATGARWVAVATTTVATTATGHGRRSTAVSGSAAEAAATAVAALRSTAPVTGTTAEAATAATHATNIAGGSAAATTAAATAAATATTEAGALTSDALEELGNLLVGLLEQLEEVTDNTTVTAVEESSGNTSVSGTTGTTDTVDVVVNVSGEIVVDHVSNVRNILLKVVSECFMQEAFKVLKTELVDASCWRHSRCWEQAKKGKTYKTTSSNSSGDKDGATAVTEHLEGLLTLTLSAVTVNGGGGETLVDEEVG